MKLCALLIITIICNLFIINNNNFFFVNAQQQSTTPTNISISTTTTCPPHHQINSDIKVPNLLDSQYRGLTATAISSSVVGTVLFGSSVFPSIAVTQTAAMILSSCEDPIPVIGQDKMNHTITSSLHPLSKVSSILNFGGQFFLLLGGGQNSKMTIRFLLLGSLQSSSLLVFRLFTSSSLLSSLSTDLSRISLPILMSLKHPLLIESLLLSLSRQQTTTISTILQIKINTMLLRTRSLFSKMKLKKE